jgi:hypothetical protein
MGLEAGYLELTASELADFLLRETRQVERGTTNPADLLSYLKLVPVVLDLEAALPGRSSKPRGVLAFPERVVAVQSGLLAQRARFTVLHEIAHYVLPQHRADLYLCDDADLGFWTRNDREREANEFAADLVFQGDRFTLEASAMPVSAVSVKSLKEKYEASFEATARRLVAKCSRPCMLVVFQPAPSANIIDTSQVPKWVVKYAIPSPSFANQFFQDIRLGDVPCDVAALVTEPRRDIANSVMREMVIPGPQGQRYELIVEFFSNHFSIFALLQPCGGGK